MSTMSTIKFPGDTTAREIVDKLARSYIGDVTSLNTSEKSNLVAALNEVSNSSNKVEVDTTLAVSGQAADAKTVGDKIGDLSTLTTTVNTSLVAAINEAAEPDVIEDLIPYYDLVTDFNLPAIPDTGDSISVGKAISLTPTDIASNFWNNLANGPVKVKFQVSVEEITLNVEKIIIPNFSVEQNIYEINIPARWYSTYGFIVLQFAKSSNQISIYGWYDKIDADLLEIPSMDDIISVPEYTENDYGKYLTVNADGPFWNSLSVSEDGSISTTIQSDWIQNNSDASDYIKNRPFYDEGEIVEIPIITEVEIPFENAAENVWVYQSSAAPTIPEEGTEYKIVFGDKVYNYPCRVEQLNGDTFYSLGTSYIELIMASEINVYPLEPISIIILPDGNTITFVFDSETAPGPFSLYKVVNVKETTIINDTYTLLRDDATSNFISMLPSFDLIPEATYTITVDGVENTLTCSINNAEYLDPMWIYILETDNMYIILGNTVSLIRYTDATIASDITSIEKNIKVTGYVSGIKKLSAKYIDGNISSSNSSGSSSSGSTLPSVTTVDNDKVLMVVNGVWAAASIPSGDEVAY